MKAYNKDQLIVLLYHKAIRQEGAVYPSCLDFLFLLYQDKRKIESEYSFHQHAPGYCWF